MLTTKAILTIPTATNSGSANTHLLDENPDPIYGDGFRRVRAICERRGLPALLLGVAQHRRWARG